MNKLDCEGIDAQFRAAIADANTELPWPCHPGTTEGISLVDGHLLMNLVRASASLNIYEVGTNRGFSSALMARSMVSKGAIVTCDINPNLTPDFRGFTDYIHPILGDVDTLLRWSTDPFDMAFIDGDHTYAGAKRDILALLPRAKPGALLVLHDLELPGVRQARLETLGDWCLHHVPCEAVNQIAVYHKP